VWRSWHPNGVNAELGQYDRGKKQGEWFSWFPSGERRASGHYQLGDKEGDWRYWSRDGAELSGIRICVRDLASGRAITHARVGVPTLGYRSGRGLHPSDDRGLVVFESVPAGEHQVVVELRTGGAPVQTTVTVEVVLGEQPITEVLLDTSRVAPSRRLLGPPPPEGCSTR